MQNVPFTLDSGKYKSFVFNDSKIVITSKKEPNVTELFDDSKKTGMLESRTTIALNGISSISYNDAEANLKIEHADGKDTFTFDELPTMIQVATHLGSVLGLSKTIESEKTLMPLIFNLAGALFAIAATIYGGFFHHVGDLDGSRRKGRLLALIFDTLGPIGSLVVGGAITAYLIYSAKKRYDIPASLVSYKR
jgi:hypothetical protein